MSNVLRIANLTVSNGNAVVTVNSVEVLTAFKTGDMLFVAGNLPLVVQSITGQSITLTAIAPYDANNAEGVLMASNVNLRDALDKVQENNDTWAKYFAPFLIWMASTNDTEPMEDSQGNVKQVRTPHKLDQMADNINAAAANLGTLEQDVQTLQTTVDNQQSTLDAAKIAAEGARDDTLAAEVRVGQAETRIDTKYNDFDDRYLGGFATAPTTDNRGGALVAGATYFNTSDNYIYVWTGTVWKSTENVVVTSAASAAQSETDAQTAATNSEAAWNSFRAVNLGRHANAPTTDLDGGTLVNGMSYYNTTSETYHIRINGNWIDLISDMTAIRDTTLGYRNTAETHRDDAQTAAGISMANANFVGEWSAQVGAANIPMSVKHGTTIYQLNSNLADITTSEPNGSNNPDWFVLGSIGGVATDAARLGGNLPAYYATAASVAAIDLNSLGGEPAFSKNTAHNKDFGNTAGTVAEGNHTHADLQAGIDRARILGLAAL